MLITKPEELLAIYPTSRFTSLKTVTNIFESVERGLLQQVLGPELLMKIVEDYKAIISFEDGIWGDRVDSPDDNIYIIRACQTVEVYQAFCDNVGILSSSANPTGGFNQVSSESYDVLDKDVRKELKADLYHGAKRALEMLLMLLEQDALKDKIYTALWKKSHYYYYQSRLLFPTALSMHPYYMDLGEQPHSKFVSLISSIHDCQDRYIGLRIGNKLLDEFIDVVHESVSDSSENNSNSSENNSNSSENNSDSSESNSDSSESISDSTEENVSTLEDEDGAVVEETEDTTEDASDASQDENEGSADDATDSTTNAPTTSDTDAEEDNSEQRHEALVKVLPHLLLALSFYVKCENEEKAEWRERFEHRGNQHMNLGINILLENATLFHDELATDLAEDYHNKFHRYIDEPDPSTMTDEEKKNLQRKLKYERGNSVCVIGGCLK